MEPIANWRKVGDEWRLFVRKYHRPMYVATVYPNGTWFTWDENGTGGENSHNDNIEDAKMEAGGCAIRQGFI